MSYETPDKKEKINWRQIVTTIKNWLMTKAGQITAGSTIALLVLTLLIMKACEPAKAGIVYPICSAFAEQNVLFPETMKYNLVEQYSPLSIRLYYSHIDSFGQFLTEFIECKFVNNPDTGLALDVAVYNTVKEITRKQAIKNKGRLYQVEQKYIDLFNASQTPQIIQQMDPEKLDFIYPSSDPNFTY